MQHQGSIHLQPEGSLRGHVEFENHDNSFIQFNGSVESVIINSPMERTPKSTANSTIEIPRPLKENGSSDFMKIKSTILPSTKVELENSMPKKDNKMLLASCKVTPLAMRPRTVDWTPNHITVDEMQEPLPTKTPAPFDVQALKPQLYIVYATTMRPHIFKKTCLGVYGDLEGANRAVIEEVR